MGRVYDYLRIGRRRCLALFDSGARNSFAVPSVVALGRRMRLKAPLPVAIGGRRTGVREQCTLEGTLRGRRLVLNALVLPGIGHGEKGPPIEVLVGALAMRMGGIELDLKRERLDLTHYTREFVEF